MSEQFVLNLPHRTALDRQDFLIAQSNAEAISLLDAWPNWSDPVQAIIGPKACGKSHLAAVWGMMSGAYLCKSSSLTSENLADLMDKQALIIDNLEDLAQEGEQVLFHLINHARQSQKSLLLCSSLPLEQMLVKLPDLSSRLKAIVTARMHAPCDMLIAAVLVKLFNDRQLSVSEKVVNYLLPRLERSFLAVNQIVSRIDETSLQHKRPITVPIVSEVLASLEQEKGEAHV